MLEHGDTTASLPLPTYVTLFSLQLPLEEGFWLNPGNEGLRMTTDVKGLGRGE